jgi:cellulose synthase/poly-beta-1,6-N-acetylglucosamine synthase-like glycosyltransferase
MSRKLDNTLSQTYPPDRLTILVVDSASTDGTPRIVDDYCERYDNVLLIEQEHRWGVVNAINSALPGITNDVVALTEPATLLDANALRNAVSYLSADDIGGATGNLRIGESKGGLGDFRAIIHAVRNKQRQLEADVDSAGFASGELIVFKRNLVERLDEGLILEDTQIGYVIRSKGYRIVVAKDAYCYEPAQRSFKGQTKYFVRTMTVGLKNEAVYLKRMLSTRYGLFGLLILPTNFLQQTVAPALFFALLGLLFLDALLHNALLLFVAILSLCSFEALLLAIPMTRQLAKAPIYFVVLLVATITGIVNYARGKYSTTWEKLEK